MTKSYLEVAPTIELLRQVHFRTDRDELLEKQITRLFSVDPEGRQTHEPVRFTAGTETNGIIMIDGSGGGKSTAIEKVLGAFEPLTNNPETERPRYLKITVESPATQKSLGIAILKATGVDDVAERAKVWEIWSAVRVRLHRMGVSLLWIDEAHDMFKSSAGVETDNMFKMLKSLMQGDHPVVLLLSGTERLSKIAGLDPQLSRRFAKIKPNDLQMGADNADLEDLVGYLCERADLKFEAYSDLINRLIYGSRNRFGRAVETTIHAIEEALLDSSADLKIEHFEMAWGQKEACDIGQNVFSADDWMEIELDVDEDDFEAARVAATEKVKAKARKTRGKKT